MSNYDDVRKIIITGKEGEIHLTLNPIEDVESWYISLNSIREDYRLEDVLYVKVDSLSALKMN